MALCCAYGSTNAVYLGVRYKKPRINQIWSYGWSLRKIGGVYTHVGSSTRDVQIIILASCGSLPPGTITETITVNSGNQIDSITLGVCAGNTIDFNYSFSDNNTAINYNVTTNASTATPGATSNMSSTDISGPWLL